MENQVIAKNNQEEPINQPPQRFPILPIVLIFVTLFSLSSTVFFAYRNIQLNKQIMVLRNSLSDSASKELDSVSNLEIYTDTFQRISFSYPSDFIINGKETTRIFLKSPNESGLIFEVNLYKNTNLNSQFASDKNTFDKSAILEYINLNSLIARMAIYKNVRIENNNIPELKIIYFQKGNDLYAISIPDKNFVSNQILSTFAFIDNFDLQQYVNSYSSEAAGIQMSFIEPMYVIEHFTLEDDWRRGDIVISKSSPDDNENLDNLTIVYGLPYIDGKGGACNDETGSLWQKKTILGQQVDVCDINLGFHAGYPKHPTSAIEYSFFIGGKNITQSEFQMYKTIVYSGLKFVK